MSCFSQLPQMPLGLTGDVQSLSSWEVWSWNRISKLCRAGFDG